MTALGDIRAFLQIDRVEPEELTDLLTRHFGGAAQNEPRRIEFPQDGSARLALLFRADLRGIRAVATKLDEAELATLRDKIESALLRPRPGVGRVLVFSHRRVLGSWRYKDRLQLLPAPDGAPLPGGVAPEYPALLEFSYDGSHDETTDFIRRDRAGAFWVGVLNLMIPVGLWQHPKDTQFHWVLRHVDDAPQSVFSQEYYAVDGVQGPSDAFSESPALLIPLSNDPEYFDMWGSRRDAFELHASIPSLVACVEGLTRAQRESIENAAYWFGIANRRMVRSQSARYGAVMSAIEALVPRDKFGERCENCKMIRGGSTEQFRLFMRHLVPADDPDYEKVLRDLYSKRSALAHGAVLRSDREILGFTPRSWEEDTWFRYARMLSRIAILNWIEENGAAAS